MRHRAKEPHDERRPADGANCSHDEAAEFKSKVLALLRYDEEAAVMHVPTWGGRRAQAALRRVKADGERDASPCVICAQPINYKLAYPHPQSCSVQHVQSRSLRPDLTWDPKNWGPAHLDCNKADGDGTASLDLGATSQDW